MTDRVTLPSRASSAPAPSEGGVRVLVTNDDGIESPGLAVVAARLQALGCDVVVAAPDRDVSGCGTGIGGVRLDRSIDVRTVLVAGVQGHCYALPGTPGLAVMAAALGAFGRRPNLVVSGINAGVNVGGSVVHSGTVGGAITASTFGIPAVAVSVAPPPAGDDWSWPAAAAVAGAVVTWMLDHGRALTVNLNVPHGPTATVRGLRWAELADFGTFVLAAADDDDAARSTGDVVDGVRRELRVELPGAPAPGSDRALLAEGFATASSLALLDTVGRRDDLPPLPALA